ncbi:unnamed protein product [Allacma fusca]|uniref:Uncharacterized protein n=1 Tax=Allacma fusca TaxID=39272 RepID=A0A8J2PPN5_9HEXA|nr:unnamed protein product [Allacma fusca]
MRTDLGLTYNLVFPDSGRTVVGQEKSGLYENLNNPNDGTGVGESPIVVILLGWLEAKDSQLEKYSNIYLKRGCIVLRCITPTRVLYYDIAKLPAIAGQFLQNLWYQSGPRHCLWLFAANFSYDTPCGDEKRTPSLLLRRCIQMNMFQQLPTLSDLQ